MRGQQDIGMHPVGQRDAHRLHQGHHRERKCCSNVPALIPASAEPHTMQQGKLRRSKKGVGGQSSVQCTPVSASILRAAFCLASSLTSCHFF